MGHNITLLGKRIDNTSLMMEVYKILYENELKQYKQEQHNNNKKLKEGHELANHIVDRVYNANSTPKQLFNNVNAALEILEKSKPEAFKAFEDDIQQQLSQSKENDPYAPHAFYSQTTTLQRINITTQCIKKNKAIKTDDLYAQACINSIRDKNKRRELKDFFNKHMSIKTKKVSYVNKAGYHKKGLGTLFNIEAALMHIGVNNALEKAKNDVLESKTVDEGTQKIGRFTKIVNALLDYFKGKGKENKKINAEKILYEEEIRIRMEEIKIEMEKANKKETYTNNLLKLDKKVNSIIEETVNLANQYQQNENSLMETINSKLEESKVHEIEYLSDKELKKVSQLLDTALAEIKQHIINEHNLKRQATLEAIEQSESEINDSGIQSKLSHHQKSLTTHKQAVNNSVLKMDNDASNLTGTYLTNEEASNINEGSIKINKTIATAVNKKKEHDESINQLRSKSTTAKNRINGLAQHLNLKEDTPPFSTAKIEIEDKIDNSLLKIEFDINPINDEITFVTKTEVSSTESEIDSTYSDMKTKLVNEHNQRLAELNEKVQTYQDKLKKLEECELAKDNPLEKALNAVSAKNYQTLDELQPNDNIDLKGGEYLSVEALQQHLLNLENGLKEAQAALVNGHNNRLNELTQLLNQYQKTVSQLEKNYELDKSGLLNQYITNVRSCYDKLNAPKKGSVIQLNGKEYLSENTLDHIKNTLKNKLKVTHTSIVQKNESQKNALLHKIKQCENKLNNTQLESLISHYQTSLNKHKQSVNQCILNQNDSISQLSGIYLTSKQANLISLDLDRINSAVDQVLAKKEAHDQNINQLIEKAKTAKEEIDHLAQQLGLDKETPPFSTEKEAIDKTVNAVIKTEFKVDPNSGTVISSITNDDAIHANQQIDHYCSALTNFMATEHNQRLNMLNKAIQTCQNELIKLEKCELPRNNNPLHDILQQVSKTKYEALDDELPSNDNIDLKGGNYLSAALLAKHLSQLKSGLQQAQQNVIQQHENHKKEFINEIKDYRNAEIEELITEYGLPENINPISQVKNDAINSVLEMELLLESNTLIGNYLPEKVKQDKLKETKEKIDVLIADHIQQASQTNVMLINEASQKAKQHLNDLYNVQLELNDNDEAAIYINQQKSALPGSTSINTSSITNSEKDKAISAINEHTNETNQGVINIHNRHREELMQKIDEYQRKLDQFKSNDGLTGSNSELETAINQEKERFNEDLSNDNISRIIYLSSSELEGSLNRLESAFNKTNEHVENLKQVKSCEKNIKSLRTDLNRIKVDFETRNDLIKKKDEKKIFTRKLTSIKLELERTCDKLETIENSNDKDNLNLKLKFDNDTTQEIKDYYDHLKNSIKKIEKLAIYVHETENKYETLKNDINNSKRKMRNTHSTAFNESVESEINKLDPIVNEMEAHRENYNFLLDKMVVSSYLDNLCPSVDQFIDKLNEEKPFSQPPIDQLESIDTSKNKQNSITIKPTTTIIETTNTNKHYLYNKNNNKNKLIKIDRSEEFREKYNNVNKDPEKLIGQKQEQIDKNIWDMSHYFGMMSNRYKTPSAGKETDFKKFIEKEMQYRYDHSAWQRVKNISHYPDIDVDRHCFPEEDWDNFDNLSESKKRKNLDLVKRETKKFDLLVNHYKNEKDGLKHDIKEIENRLKENDDVGFYQGIISLKKKLGRKPSNEDIQNLKRSEQQANALKEAQQRADKALEHAQQRYNYCQMKINELNTALKKNESAIKETKHVNDSLPNTLERSKLSSLKSDKEALLRAIKKLHNQQNQEQHLINKLKSFSPFTTNYENQAKNCAKTFRKCDKNGVAVKNLISRSETNITKARKLNSDRRREDCEAVLNDIQTIFEKIDEKLKLAKEHESNLPSHDHTKSLLLMWKKNELAPFRDRLLAHQKEENALVDSLSNNNANDKNIEQTCLDLNKKYDCIVKDYLTSPKKNTFSVDTIIKKINQIFKSINRAAGISQQRTSSSAAKVKSQLQRNNKGHSNDRKDNKKQRPSSASANSSYGYRNNSNHYHKTYNPQNNASTNNHQQQLTQINQATHASKTPN